MRTPWQWRHNFKSKFPDKASDADGWDMVTFLNKAKLTIKGRMTRTALLLLGREEAEHFLSPAEAKIAGCRATTWAMTGITHYLVCPCCWPWTRCTPRLETRSTATSAKARCS